MGRSKLEAATYVVKTLREYGLPANSHSRFQVMLAALRNGPIAPGDSRFETVLESVRDIGIMEFVFDHRQQIAPLVVLAEKIRAVIADAVLPQHDSELTIGRNIQAELYVAAILAKAGLRPTIAEPDIVCIHDGITYGIAVKRLKSDGQIEKRIREAMKQIERSDLPGHIALDVTAAFNRSNERFVSVSDERIDHAAREARDRFRRDYYDRIKQWARGRDIISVILIDHILRFVEGDGWGMSTYHFGIPLSLDNQRRYKQFCTFANAFARGTATPSNPF